VRSGDIEVADGVQRDTGKKRGCSRWSIASWSNEEARPERARAVGALGDGVALDLLHVLDKRKASEDALDQGEERETEKRQQDHLETSESTTHGGSDIELRRAIRAAWRHNRESKKGEMERRGTGFL
jgi:hypothetical protein